MGEASEEVACAAIDIGGTSVKAALVTCRASGLELGSILTRRHSGRDVAMLVGDVIELVHECANGIALQAVAISTTGYVARDGQVTSCAFFEGYTRFFWKSALGSAVGPGVEISVLNDGQAAALGAYAVEFGATVDSLALFTIGTGLGGGAICGGALLRGARGLAAAFGHIPARVPTHKLCVCGRLGCAENECSGLALASAWLGHRASADEVCSALDDLREDLLKGSERAAGILRDAGGALGGTIAEVAVILDPEVVVLTGGVLSATDDARGRNLMIEAAIKAATALLPPGAVPLRIERSKLENPSLLGAAAFACRGRSTRDPMASGERSDPAVLAGT